MPDLSDLNEFEFLQLANKLEGIIQLASESAQMGNPNAHIIYVMARDCRDLIIFDAVSRETMRKLIQNPFPTVDGLQFNQAVIDEINSDRKVSAIKELRISTGCGLKDAKNAVERYMTEIGLGV